MIEIKPFKGTRPHYEKAENLIAPSTDYLSEAGMLDIFEKNYWNYLKVLNPVGTTKEEESLKAAKDHFSEMKNNDIVKKDNNSSYYIYQIKTSSHVQTGFLAVANIDLYISDKIKGHELTYKDRSNERANQMLNLNTQIGPIYVTYEDDHDLDDLLFQLTLSIPHYDFISFDNSRHSLWCIEDSFAIENLTNLVKNIDNLYIADGHHRMKAMQFIYELKKQQNKDHTGKEGYNFFMLSAFPKSKSKIYDYNRVIRDLNGLNLDHFIQKIKNNFECILSKNPVHPTKRKEFGMYHDKKWYILRFLKDDLLKDDILSKLDINIINDFCLKPILGIKDVNTDNRIRFIAGFHGLEALENKVNDNPDSVAFSFYPTNINDVIEVANNNLTMPPKSTWFDPKPIDGLVVYEFDQ